MKKDTHHKLIEKGLIDEKQFSYLNSIAEKEKFSVYYELRTLLYLGVLLLTTGVALLIYTNLGEFGHYIALLSIAVICILSFRYVIEKEIPFSNQKLESPTPYYDYALLIGALLFISFQGYLQFMYDIFEGYWSYNTLINSIILFLLAYRFDHIGLLSMAISSLASFIGITVTPQDWINYDLFEFKEIYQIGIGFSIILAAVGISLDYKDIKKHFTFTYVNFASLIFFFCVFTGLFEHRSLRILYFFLLALGIGGAIIYANWKKSFIFLIYAFLSGYVGITYLFILMIDFDSIAIIYFWALYTIGSCIGFMQFVKRFKNHYNK